MDVDLVDYAELVRDQRARWVERFRQLERAAREWMACPAARQAYVSAARIYAAGVERASDAEVRSEEPHYRRVAEQMLLALPVEGQG